MSHRFDIGPIKTAQGVEVGDTTHTMVAAVATKIIKVLALTMSGSGNVNTFFTDGTVTISGMLHMVDHDFVVLPFSEAGWFWTQAVNRALIVDSSAAAVAFHWGLVYTLLDSP